MQQVTARMCFHCRDVMSACRLVSQDRFLAAFHKPYSHTVRAVRAHFLGRNVSMSDLFPQNCGIFESDQLFHAYRNIEEKIAFSS
jgi:hypothetical protein